MATQSATFTFALPEDLDSDTLRIYSSSTQTGTYSLVTSVTYEYGTTQYEYASLSDTTWYKIQFFNSGNSVAGPISEAVYGGTYSNAAPTLVVSTTSDGAYYATTQDVYDYSNLNSSDISTAKVSSGLRQARAQIDYRMAEANIDRFQVFDTDVARRKYNATLRIIKEAEICLALSTIYDNLSDDKILESIRSGDEVSDENISIGSTSISGGSLGERSENILYLSSLAARYAAKGEQLLASLDAPTTPLVPYDYAPFVRSPRFNYPIYAR